MKRSFALVAFGVLAASALAQAKFAATYSADAFAGPFTGRVVVYFTKGNSEPRFGPNWFRPEPMLTVVAKNLKPGEKIVIEPSKAITFPKQFAADNAEWNVQVVFDRNLGGRDIGSSEGNLYSVAKKVAIDWKADQTIDLLADKVIAPREFKDTESVKGVKLESKLLSRFFNRPTFMEAAVVLPEGYDPNGSTSYPVIYSIPGFGGTHWGLSGRETRRGTVRDGEKFIMVHLNPDCWTGHSVFADSANNGPWGKALTEKLIPHIEKQFKAVGKAGGRFVTGHSSGGWSSLWLQVAYPDFFGGTWSTAPDPIDFRDFQIINIYRKGENMFRDPEGKPRPLARQGGRVTILYEAFSDMERPLRGEQLGSFDGVFSPKGRDGEPMPLWNRITGEIDPKVAEHWKKYDIGLILRTQADKLAPKLKGKLHVYAGDVDTFYLEGAVKLVINDIEGMGNPYEAKIEIFPGDHGSMLTRALMERIDREMAAQFRKFKEAGG